MAYASQAGRAKTSSTAPRAHAICDRCGFRYNFDDLAFQFDWRGATLQNLRILVCNRCTDEPQEQLRAITLPADPVSIINARPELYSQDSLDYIGTGQPTIAYPSGIPIPSQNVMGGSDANTVIIPQPLGTDLRPNASGQLNPSSLGDPNAQMPLVKAVHWAARLALTSIVSNGTPIVTGNCSQPHQLSTGAQVAIWGVTNPLAYGIFSVTVVNPVVFTFQANANVKTGSLAIPSTIAITVNVGLPWQVTQVPQTGI